MDRKENGMKITFFNTYWPLNIGNAFIDLGSVQSVKSAMPSSTIYTISNYPRALFEEKSRNSLERIAEKAYRNYAIKKLNRKATTVKIKILKRNRVLKEPNNMIGSCCFDLGRAVKSDYAVISGMILWDYFIKQNKATILALKKKNVKIIFNGVGGPYYSENEIAMVRKFLKEIGLYAFISRDKMAFKYYHDLAEHSHDGIDCAFFIANHYTPPKLEIPEYVILNFDKLPEPKANMNGKLVIHTHHYSREIYTAPKRYFTMPNTLVSDSPYDYLTLYSNTSATFSDRVHGCVVTLSYGRPARLFVEDDPEILNRMLLFKKIGANTIASKLTHSDTGKIDKEKKMQVKFLSEILAHA